MSVYVGPMETTTSRPWLRTKRTCLLVADNRIRLRAIASKLFDKIVLSRNGHSVNHYELTESQRQRAIELGALELSKEQALHFLGILA